MQTLTCLLAALSLKHSSDTVDILDGDTLIRLAQQVCWAVHLLRF